SNFPRRPPPSAAGRYQITADTFNTLSRQLGLSDFSPHSQDLMAVQYLINVGAINGAVAGDLDAVLPGAAHPWASLPESHTADGLYNKPQYGYQRSRPYYDVSARYQQELARNRSNYPDR